MKRIVLVSLLIAVVALSCDDGNGTPTHTHEWEWVETTQATTTANGLETETCKTCGAKSGNTRIIEQTEPTVKTFQTKDLFEGKTATIKDERTNCGKQNLEQLGIVTQIENAIIAGFNEGTGMAAAANKNRFRAVFGESNGGVTIIVNNPSTPYELKAPDGSTIYFHIDYLKSNPVNIQQNIIDAVKAMNPDDPNLPYNADAPAPATITQETPNGLAFAGKVTIKSDDQYTVAEWDAVVQKVVTALNRGYGKDMSGLESVNEFVFAAVFAEAQNVEVIVSKSASHNVEVKSDDYTKLYLKEVSLDTVDVQPAVWIMSAAEGDNYQANTTPAKDRVFLALSQAPHGAV